MASTKIGNCAYIYGFGAAGAQNIACITIESISEETAPEFEAEATDDDGNVAAVVRGPDMQTFNISGYTKAGSDLDCHTCKVTIQTDSGANSTGYVEKWSINRSNSDFAKCELSVKCYPAASVCCP